MNNNEQMQQILTDISTDIANSQKIQLEMKSFLERIMQRLETVEKSVSDINTGINDVNAQIKTLDKKINDSFDKMN